MTGTEHAMKAGNQRSGALNIVALIGIALAGASTGLADAGAWEVIAGRDGIVVSRRPVEERDFPRLRAVAEVPGTPYEVLAILQDVSTHVEWRPDCLESKVVRTAGTWQSVVYTRTNAPWPVSDREVVLKNEVLFVDPPSKVKVTFDAIPAPNVEHRRGTVRMQYATGYFLIEAIGAGRSRVTYELDADPGGHLPGWLISMESKKHPMETLAGIRERLGETRGDYAEQIARFPGN